MKVYLAVLMALHLLACAHVQDRHTINKGETPERIAHRYQLSSKQLSSLNEWEDLARFLPKDVTINLSKARGPLKANFSLNLKPAVYREPDQTTPFIWPLKGKLTSRFGRRWGTLHNGIDISAPMGTPIKAVKAGKVIHSGIVSGYGKIVVVYHGRGLSTIYAHASKLLVSKGTRIQKGQRIALVGSSGRSTGPHLHFEVRRYKEPIDPMKYLVKTSHKSRRPTSP